MRSYDPNDEYDVEEKDRIQPEQWQLDLLKYNPDYTCWGPYEDYMSDKGGQWNSPVFHDSWQDFGPWGLDDLNECVNFYFEIERESKECPSCEGNGYHPDAQQVVRTFYNHSCYPGEVEWCDKITQDELDALIEAGRIRKEGVDLETVNGWNRHGPTYSGLESHDAINRWILIEQRLKRLGLPKTCPTCGGHGHVYTKPKAHVNLILWMIHPRKGCSRGVEIKNIQKTDLPDVYNYLKEAARRNAGRFDLMP